MNQERKSDLMLLTITVLLWFSLYVYTPFLSPHLEGMQMGASMIGVIIGAYGFTQLILRVPISIGEDVTGRHKLFMSLGLIVLMAGSALPLMSDAPWVYLLFRAFAGVGASTWVCYTVVYAAGEKGRERMGQIVTANNLGILASFFAGNALYRWLGMKALLVSSIAAAGLALVLLMIWKPRKTELKPSFHWADFRMLLENKRLWLFSLLMALGQLIVFATAMSFAANYAKEMGAGSTELSLLSVAFYGAGMLASRMFEKKRFGGLSDRTLLAVSFGILALYCAALPFCRSAIWIIAAQFAGGFGRTIQYTLLMAESIAGVHPNQKTTAMGIFQSVYSIGMTLGSAVMGWMLDGFGSYGIAFGVMAGIAALGILFSLLGYRTMGKEDKA